MFKQASPFSIYHSALVEKIMIDGKRLRKEILSKRDELGQDEIRTKSEIIARSLLSEEVIREARTLFIYVNFRSEVETMWLIKQLIMANKTVSVPRTVPREKRLEIVTITDPETELVPGYCEIPEPRSELLSSRSIAVEEIDVVILPGSVFDHRCGRFGYGGGYYDRLLASIPKASRIALAFELQVVEKLPLKAHDERLDCIITENRHIRCSRVPARRR
ncbi:MAG: 5-formyltetrahydrofolate cyclo-ligase [Desulfobacterales bacterium]|nr:MAG: 5-formyltetrahydrofolate cyclo-ligase [Desulfobacterales bacterium]